ncbi:MAG: toll/interleukin-1 receptor domain-containing protein [Deltaproteobacteria bacterium]|nr:toll/interleukin-1 receptor domain-containing protein [Deltaproteobacteria bacterium]
MNSYQRLSLINEIAYKLQQEMTTSEINILLSPYKLNGAFHVSVGSKRVYVRDLLQSEDILKIVHIAKDLEMDLSNYEENIIKGNTDTSVWLSNKRKVFISHLAKDKEKASKIQHYLLRKDISGFVAHEDIEPNNDWQNSIEYALKTMDFLVALITPGFFSSIWTNQEIGYALGMNRKVVPFGNRCEEFC